MSEVLLWVLHGIGGVMLGWGVRGIWIVIKSKEAVGHEQRYVTTCDCMRPAAWGDFVRHEDYETLAAENARLRAELEQSRDLTVEMSKRCNATALVADWLERNQ